MAETFDIMLSKSLIPADLAAAIADLIPPGLRVDVRRDMSELPDEPGAVWAVVGDTDDPAWPCVMNVLVCRDECGLGPYPDLRVAAGLWERFGTDTLCGTYPFVSDLDPHDPFWSLACVSGQWYLASTVNARFMWSDTDREREPLTNEGVRFVRPVVVPDARGAKPDSAGM